MLIGTMAVYGSQLDGTAGVPQQWRDFRLRHPFLGDHASFYGASPCTEDGKIHYLTGVEQGSLDGAASGERLTLAAGEYAVILIQDPALLRETWALVAAGLAPHLWTQGGACAGV